jgi:hypothetical protein
MAAAATSRYGHARVRCGGGEGVRSEALGSADGALLVHEDDDLDREVTARPALVAAQ